ncbi:MAG TPA: hypothetical protein VIC86_09535 [Acidimicrobiales bacterium]
MDPPEAADAAAVRTGARLTGSDAAKLHLTLAIGLALCGLAFVFELGRALGGNSLSWAYVFEWPLFAVFAVYMWWSTLHQSRHGRHKDRRPTVAPEHVQMLKAWQDHRRQMAATEAEMAADPEHGSLTAETEPGSRR